MTQPENQAPDRSHDQPAAQAALDRHRAEGHWAALAGRMLDDVVRIVEAETRLLEVNFGRALTAAFDRAVGQFLGSLLVFLGGACVLAALIMLLHEWLPVWLSLAISGAIAIGVGLAVAWNSGRVARKAESEMGGS
jgi:hypothetical protein